MSSRHVSDSSNSSFFVGGALRKDAKTARVWGNRFSDSEIQVFTQSNDPIQKIFVCRGNETGCHIKLLCSNSPKTRAINSGVSSIFAARKKGIPFWLLVLPRFAQLLAVYLELHVYLYSANSAGSSSESTSAPINPLSKRV